MLLVDTNILVAGYGRRRVRTRTNNSGVKLMIEQEFGDETSSAGTVAPMSVSFGAGLHWLESAAAVQGGRNCNLDPDRHHGLILSGTKV